MGLGIPVPKDVTDRLDKMESDMSALVAGINTVVGLLEEQNELLRTSAYRHEH